MQTDSKQTVNILCKNDLWGSHIVQQTACQYWKGNICIYKHLFHIIDVITMVAANRVLTAQKKQDIILNSLNIYPVFFIFTNIL